MVSRELRTTFRMQVLIRFLTIESIKSDQRWSPFFGFAFGRQTFFVPCCLAVSVLTVRHNYDANLIKSMLIATNPSKRKMDITPKVREKAARQLAKILKDKQTRLISPGLRAFKAPSAPKMPQTLSQLATDVITNTRSQLLDKVAARMQQENVDELHLALEKVELTVKTVVEQVANQSPQAATNSTATTMKPALMMAGKAKMSMQRAKLVASKMINVPNTKVASTAAPVTTCACKIHH